MILGGLTMFAGCAQAGLDEEFLPRMHFPLLFVAYGAIPFVLGLVAARFSETRPRSPFLLRHVGTFSFLFVGTAIGVQAANEYVCTVERHEMSWSLETHRHGTGDWTNVRLEFVAHPGWSTVVGSEELGSWLEARGEPRVPVEILVIRDFGRLRKFKVVEVASRPEGPFSGPAGFHARPGWMLSLSRSGDPAGPPPIR